MSSTALSFMSSEEVSTRSIFSWRISFFEPLRSYRVSISRLAWLTALATSCMSTLHAMSKLFSAAIDPSGRLLTNFERDHSRPLGRREREEGIAQAGVDGNPVERHRHGVLELVVEHGLADDVALLRIEGEHEPCQERRRLLGREVEDGPARGVRLVGRVQEAHGELLAHFAESLEKAPRRTGQRLGRVALVDLVELGRVDPEVRAVGDDLLGRRALVLPAHLAALPQIDGALGLDVLPQALVLRHLRELGPQVDHLAVRRLERVHHLLELLRTRDDRQQEEREQRERKAHYLPRFAKYSGPTRISRGLAPWPGPMIRSCSIMSMKRAAFGYPSPRRRWRNEMDAARC